MFHREALICMALLAGRNGKSDVYRLDV